MRRIHTAVMATAALAATAVLLIPWDEATAGEDDLARREFLAKAAKKALARHNSEETAFHSEKSEDKEDKTGLAKWTEQAETWLYFDDPEKTLRIDITKLELKDGVSPLRVGGERQAEGKARGKVPRLVDGDVKATANADLTREGMAKFGDNKLTDVEITMLEGKLGDFRPSADPLKAMHGLIQDAANNCIKHKEDDLKEQLKKSLEEFRP